MLIALALCRLLHFAATMLVFGAALFLAVLAPAALARDLGRRLCAPIIAAAILALLSALAWLALEAASMGEGWSDAANPDTLGAVLFQTEFGGVWGPRLALAAIALALAIFAPRPRALALVAAALLASLGLVDHSAMREGAIGAAQRAIQAIHLLAGGAWLGGLPPLVLCLGMRDDSDRRADATMALRRFSTMGYFAVALVVFTGIANTALILRKPPIDLASPYQALLDAKIAIVATMILIALWNRFALAPRIATSGERAIAALRINALGEIALGLAVLALVSLFGLLSPT